ncbi:MULTISPECIES: DUF2007 domain-containing protein [unclassified Luteimonas]|uniref:DUF2007 domain-containing protein n=1 Tax=unclassified Luteimonas TaxID=2629088 RepID=UPI0018F08356|nr:MULTISPECIES: DUF2007 domain-containing protein [unclassified Luteimonas]MBJ6978701.1 DUF2007 domain-containing protein [Luteimonas sp. MC1895]MBJ6983601.1 DUF2007 domain-containing protein [Luteimonas sp. MC1750]QQO06445.1 DUF2007 domain-containing protein [Luteimonas sp. MC1750]
MRQVFSSPRIENVEAVARMLTDAGIEARVSNGRSYRGAIRGNFSYRDGGGGAPRPSVWVIRSDQQPEARRMLREAGLLQSPARGQGFLPSGQAAGAGAGAAAAQPARGGGRFRYGLLLAVAVMAALAMLAWRAGRDDTAPAGLATPTAGPSPDAPAAPAASPLSGVPDITALPDTAFVVATPPALAATLVRSELSAAGDPRACLSIDGADPAPELLRELAAAGLDVLSASACGDDRVAVAVSGYTTDGSGRGTVQLAVGTAPPRTLAVRREGRDWLLDDAAP